MKIFGLELPKIRSESEEVPGANKTKTQIDVAKELLGTGDDPVYDKPSRRLLRQSRKSASSNLYAHRYLNILQELVSGPAGIRLITLKSDKSVHQSVQSSWDKWLKIADLTGRSALEFQHDMILRLARDGEIILRIHESDEMFRLELVDSAVLPFDDDEDKVGDYVNDQGIKIRMKDGIEFDTQRRPKTYHFKQSSGNLPVDAKDIIHLYRMGIPSMVRGMSWLAPVLNVIKTVDDYRSAFILGARNAAANPFYFVIPPVSRRDTNDENTETANDTAMKISAGEIMAIDNPKIEHRTIDRGSALSNFADTNAAMVATISAGLLISYDLLSGDPSRANMSSLQAAGVVNTALFKDVQGFVEVVYRKIFQRWASWALANDPSVSSGVARVNLTFSYPKIPSALRHRDIQVTKSLVDMKAKSVQSAIRDEGDDVEATFKEIEDFRGRFESVPPKEDSGDSNDTDTNTDDKSSEEPPSFPQVPSK